MIGTICKGESLIFAFDSRWVNFNGKYTTSVHVPSGRIPKDQRIVYRGYGLVTSNHGYTWTIAGLGYTGLLGLREAKRAVDDYFRAVNAQKRWEELAEL